MTEGKDKNVERADVAGLGVSELRGVFTSKFQVDSLGDQARMC